MPSLILENKWLILLVLEALAWLSTLFAAYARYRLQSRLWFRVGSALVVATGVIPQTLMGIFNYLAHREIDLFTVVLAVLIVYGCTAGRGHVRRFDAWAKRRFGPPAGG